MEKKLSEMPIADLLAMYQYHAKQWAQPKADSIHLEICHKIYPEYAKRIRDIFDITLPGRY